jgi:hypothetical protein
MRLLPDALLSGAFQIRTYQPTRMERDGVLPAHPDESGWEWAHGLRNAPRVASSLPGRAHRVFWKP